ncbi:putative citrate transporter [Cladochytrium replicatum]|nr:putative citrate transporter [Cladochytrium replicatum]
MKQPSEGPGIIFWSWADFGRNLALLSICLLSVLATPRTHYRENNFSFAPLIEVALIFFNIFITLVPILLMFSAREDGALGFLVRGVTQPWHYFWTTGALSAVLDNSPTYVLFFNVAGGDALILTTEKAAILSAISAGAVFFGAVTYIGNAPNFLVRNVAHEAGVKMPSFVSYVGWSFAVLTPTFAVVTAIFYRH